MTPLSTRESATRPVEVRRVTRMGLKKEKGGRRTVRETNVRGITESIPSCISCSVNNKLKFGDTIFHGGSSYSLTKTMISTQQRRRKFLKKEETDEFLNRCRYLKRTLNVWPLHINLEGTPALLSASALMSDRTDVIMYLLKHHFLSNHRSCATPQRTSHFRSQAKRHYSSVALTERRTDCRGAASWQRAVFSQSRHGICHTLRVGEGKGGRESLITPNRKHQVRYCASSFTLLLAGSGGGG